MERCRANKKGIVSWLCKFHKLAIDELEAFDYDEYKKNGFKVNKSGDYDLILEDKPE